MVDLIVGNVKLASFSIKTNGSAWDESIQIVGVVSLEEEDKDWRMIDN